MKFKTIYEGAINILKKIVNAILNMIISIARF